jgi:two-component system nitrate/nitrite response regulator NarL
MRSLLAGTELTLAWSGDRWSEAVSAVERCYPAILVADFRSDAAKLFSAAAEVMRRVPRPHFVLLTHEASSEFVGRVLACGIDAYLTKDISSGGLIDALRLVVQGHKILPAGLSAAYAQFHFSAAPPKGLSLREMEILSHVRAGRSNKQIANRLDIAEGTVKVHLKSVLKKVNVRNRTQAAIWAKDNGIASA